MESALALEGRPEMLRAIGDSPLPIVGGPGPNLHVAQKIADNAFRVAGGSPGLEVSWTVTGVRNDPWVEAHGAPVETDKPESERGLYRRPELYGQPPSKGIDFVPATEQAPLAMSTNQ